MDEFFARNRLSAYLDGELPTAEAREVEDALARSPELRAELESLQAAVTLLRAGGPMKAPRGFAERLEARIEREPVAIGWRRHLRGVRIEAVMLAAAAALVLVFLAKKQPEPEVPAEPPVAATETPTTADPAPPPVDVAAVPTPVAPDRSDGVLGAAPAPKAPSPQKEEALRIAAKKSGSKAGLEKDPYVPAWEQQSESPPPSVYSPAPFQYRLRPRSDAGLRDLAALAASLGGSLADARGKPLAPYPMESGETRTVRLMLPSMSAGTVAARLGELGEIEVVNTGDRTLYAGGATVPVVVEVTQP